MSNHTTELGKAKRTLFLMLNEHLTFVGPDIVTYTEGWSDQEIRQAVQIEHPDSNITLNTITGTRIRSWGGLFKAPKKTDAQRIAELEATVAALLAERKDVDKVDKVVEDTEATPTGSVKNLFN